MFGCLLVLAGIPLLLYFLIVVYNDAARESLRFYAEERLLRRVEQEPTVNNRLNLLLWLSLDLLPMSVFLFLRRFIPSSLRSKRNIPVESKGRIFFFLCMGLCGVLPLCLTLVQREMYYVPAIPFFAIAVALAIATDLEVLISRITTRLLKLLNRVSLGMVLICCIYALSQWKKDARDHEILEDVRQIGEQVGRSKMLYAPYEVYSRWNLQFYLLRYYHISLSAMEQHKNLSALYRLKAEPETPNQRAESCLQLNTVQLFLRDSTTLKQ